MRQNIILTGFMGTGKTTVGRLLAARLERTLVDTDEVIVTKSGRSIAELFRQEGEAAFRRWESRVSRDLAGQEGLVIATGGRLMLDPDNAAVLSQNGLVFCLTAEPEEIVARLADDERRPLLDVPDPARRIGQLLAQRQAGYGRFPQIDTSGKSPEQVVEEIVQCIFAT